MFLPIWSRTRLDDPGRTERKPRAASDEAKAAADELAKQQPVMTQVVIETYSTDHEGSYANATVASLQHIEPTVPDNLEVESTSGTYTISVPSEGSNWFAISNEEGPLSYTCGEPGKGACPANGRLGIDGPTPTTPSRRSGPAL